MRPSTGLAALALLFSGCVALDDAVSPAPPVLGSDAGFDRLDPGARNLDSLHFRTSAYSADKAEAASQMAEDLYRKL
ncbi:hypothetical protein EPO15_05495, partial [bacterium]